MKDRHHSMSFFTRLFQTFRSNCGDDDVWADLSPWELCATPCDVEPKPEIPSVVSIVEEGSDIISDIYENRHYDGMQSRGSAGHTAETESDTEPSTIFSIKRRKKKKISKQKERESPPSHHSRRRAHTSYPPVVDAQRRPRNFPPLEPSPEKQKELWKRQRDIPQNIYTQPKVQHHIVRL